MNKMEMMQAMISKIKDNSRLAISEWQGTFKFKQGEPQSSALVNLNEINIPESPEMPEGQMTAVEMLVASMAACYATTLHKNAYEKQIPLPEVTVQVTGKFDLRPFFGLSEGNPGIEEPSLVLTVTSPANKVEIEVLAEGSLIQSPVLRSLNKAVSLTVNTSK